MGRGWYTAASTAACQSRMTREGAGPRDGVSATDSVRFFFNVSHLAHSAANRGMYGYWDRPTTVNRSVTGRGGRDLRPAHRLHRRIAPAEVPGGRLPPVSRRALEGCGGDARCVLLFLPAASVAATWERHSFDHGRRRVLSRLLDRDERSRFRVAPLQAGLGFGCHLDLLSGSVIPWGSIRHHFR